jgi:hypothetical protein
MTASKVKLVCPKYVEIRVPCKILAEPVPFVGPATIVHFVFVHKVGPVIHNCVATNRNVRVIQTVLRTDNVSMKNAWIHVHTALRALPRLAVVRLPTEVNATVHPAPKEIHWKPVSPLAARVTTTALKTRLVML